RFLVLAPNVFHVGLPEKVWVQVAPDASRRQVSVYLEDEVTQRRVTETKEISLGGGTAIQSVTVEVLSDRTSDLQFGSVTPYLLLVTEIQPRDRKVCRVLLSQDRGHIFIQTDQPIYTPTQTVLFRVFTMDHAMRPASRSFTLSVLNAGGNRVKVDTVTSNRDGLYYSKVHIPDVSQPGVWRITAQYSGAQNRTASREFEVKKFVLPSFEVSIKPGRLFYKVDEKDFSFRVMAQFSYGQPVQGSAHVRFAVTDESGENTFIRGLEMESSLVNGEAQFNVSSAEVSELLQRPLAELSGDSLYIATTVIETASGEVQEADVKVPLVSTQFSVDLSQTRRHYVPGGPLRISVMVRYADGSPALKNDVRIHVSKSHTHETTTDLQGALHHDVNLDSTGPVSITVTVKADGASASVTVDPISSPTNSFLYLSVTSGVINLGTGVKVQFRAFGSEPKHYYYLLVSRGEIRKVQLVKASTITEISIDVTPDLIPAFRLIGYYTTSGGEVIADSVWIDVKDKCEGEVMVSTDRQTYSPGSMAKLSVSGDGASGRLALLLVDKAVYGMKRDNKLTPREVFSALGSYDLGCSFGGGANASRVFSDAGVSIISPSLISPQRKGFGCEGGFRRYRRSLKLQQKMMSTVNSYSDPALRRCCRDGFTLIPMKLSCSERAQRVSSRKTENKKCAAAFLRCCQEGVELRAKMGRRTTLGRTVTDDQFEDFFDSSVASIRRHFPSSWNFKDFSLPLTKPLTLIMPDSITTWEIQTVTLSARTGLCVSNPVEVHVFKDLFVSVRLPYSVRRFEQLEVRAVIYSYVDTERQLSVYMKGVEGLCSPGTATNQKHQNVTVAAHSAQSVSFSVVPMMTGKIPIAVLIYDRELEMGLDAIEKELLVTMEGEEIREEMTNIINLGNDGRVRESLLIDGKMPNNTVPESKTNVFFTVTGDVFELDRAQVLLTPAGISALIRAPTGCGEQTMISMAPTAIAVEYLDHTREWAELPPGSRDSAIDNIEKGYSRILQYRKVDGSYGAWLHYPSSTWLTAFVVKVLSDLQRLKVVRPDEFPASVQYLIAQQSVDGSFVDPNPVIHREMQGGVGGLEEDVSLTAFVTVALHRSLPLLTREQSDRARSSITKAVRFLSDRLASLKRPYTLAITAYCLALCDLNDPAALTAWVMLKSQASDKENCYFWESSEEHRLVHETKAYLVPPTQAITVETTAYGLLTALLIRDMDFAESVACWLAKQENYGGGFRSTQDTIVALQALSQYDMKRNPTLPPSMQLQFSVPGRAERETVSLDKRGERVEQELKRLAGHQIKVDISGRGKAKIKVVKVYHSLDVQSPCKLLSLEVIVEGRVIYSESVLQDYSYYDAYGELGGEGQRDEGSEGGRREEEERAAPLSEIEWFDARARRRRDTQSSADSQKAVTYTVCISHDLSFNLSGMAIVDISLLSGFEAEREDLDKLKDLADQYISHYEITGGRVIMYFEEVIEEKYCVQFGARQTVPVGLVQPATASVYDYYEP
ncbi:CO4 protein, partial [Amia calva]|nr:CO4 protein [Amia calva]